MKVEKKKPVGEVPLPENKGALRQPFAIVMTATRYHPQLVILPCPEENQHWISHLFVVDCFCFVLILFCSSVRAEGQRHFSWSLVSVSALAWTGTEVFCSWIGRACLKNYCPTSNCSVLSPRHHLFLPLVFDYKESGGKKKTTNFLRHTGTKVRGGAAQAKSVNMKNQTKQRWNNAPLEEKSNNE